MRLNNVDDLLMAIAIGVDMRNIFRNGSSRFSNEFVFADTKQLSIAVVDSDVTSSSSTRAVSSCSLRPVVNR